MPVAILCLEDLTVEQMISEKLYILLPFYAFLEHRTIDNWDKRSKCSQDKAEKYLEEGLMQISQHLKAIVNDGAMPQTVASYLLDMADIVTKALVKGIARLEEKVKSIWDVVGPIPTLDIYIEGQEDNMKEVFKEKIQGYLDGDVTLKWAAKTSKMTEDEFLEAVEAYKAEEKATEESSGS